MIIAEFAEKYDLPPARVHRSVRSLAREALARRHGIAPDRAEDISPEPYDLDETMDQGLRVTTSEGSSQFSYEVTDEQALFDRLRDEYGQDLLSDDEVGRMLDYMEFLLGVVVDEGIRRGGILDLETRSGETYRVPWEGIEEIEHLLWRSGRIEDETYVPR
jgi:hypothetical protein